MINREDIVEDKAKKSLTLLQGFFIYLVNDSLATKFFQTVRRTNNFVSSFYRWLSEVFSSSQFFDQSRFLEFSLVSL